MVRHRMLCLALLASAALLTVGCAADKVRAMGATDLQCSPSHVDVFGGGSDYVATGCGKSIRYVCVASRYALTCFPRPRADVHVHAGD